MSLQGHCLIQVDSDTVLLVGGSNEVGLPSHYSWSYNFINGTWSVGPPLWESRYGHFCGKFKAYQNKRTFAVVAGGQSVALTREEQEQEQYTGSALPLSSVEILDISDGSSSKNWTTGFLFYSYIRNKHGNTCLITIFWFSSKNQKCEQNYRILLELLRVS
jgi:hypothetical protein